MRKIVRRFFQWRVSDKAVLVTVIVLGWLVWLVPFLWALLE